MKFTLPKIYPITDVQISGLGHAEQVRRMIDGGASLIQLREKTGPARAFYESAREAVDLAHARGVKIIVNDRVDFALAVDADGVHLGQEDLHPIHARKLLGDNKIIGYSTHSIEQALEAIDLPVDYIAIGPVFSTSTKAGHDPIVGLSGVTDVRRVIGSVPLAAIGGIDRSNAEAVFGAGADSVAVISGIVSGGDKIAQRLNALLNSMR